MENLEIANQTKERPLNTNTTTKDDLLRRAKDAIASGEQSLHDAAEALGVAQDLHNASQAEMARAIGKSKAWVSYLLQWRQSGYKGESPFGPKTRAGRVKHAEHRAASGKSKPRKPRKDTAHQTDENDAQVSADKRKAEYARQEAKPETSTPTGCQKSTPRKPTPDEAKGNLLYAIDHWWPHTDTAGKREVTKHFQKTAGVRVS